MVAGALTALLSPLVLRVRRPTPAALPVLSPGSFFPTLTFLTPSPLPLAPPTSVSTHRLDQLPSPTP